MKVSNKILIETRTDKSEYSAGEPVRISIAIINRSPNPVELAFNSAQRYDFIVLKDVQEVWRWSKDKIFAMVLGSVSLKPDETRTYTETWKATGAATGAYKVVGIVTSRPTHKATCTFEIKN